MKKVITSADVQFSSQNQVKSKKKVITSADVQFSTQNQVKRKKETKGLHVRRCPIFHPKSCEERKQVFTFAGRGSPSPELKLDKIFVFLQQMKIKNVFTVQNAEKEDIRAVFNVLGGQTIFH